MKKTKVIGIVCILLTVLLCFASCDDGGAKTITITSTLTHADGSLLQKVETTFTDEGKSYSYSKKTTSLNTLDSQETNAYSTQEENGSDATLTIPSWSAEDFAELLENTETKLIGKLTADKIAALGITDANGEVVASVELDGENVVAMTVEYINTKGATVSIVATITY